MELTPEAQQKVLAHIEAAWKEFIASYTTLIEIKPSSIATMKVGFYYGFQAGVIAMHDADKIL